MATPKNLLAMGRAQKIVGDLDAIDRRYLIERLADDYTEAFGQRCEVRFEQTEAEVEIET